MLPLAPTSESSIPPDVPSSSSVEDSCRGCNEKNQILSFSFCQCWICYYFFSKKSKIFSQKIKVCIVSPRSLTCTLLWAPSTTSTVATVFKAAPSLTDCPEPPPPTAPSVVESGTSGFCPNNRCRLGKTGCARLLLLSDDMEDRSSR